MCVIATNNADQQTPNPETTIMTCYEFDVRITKASGKRQMGGVAVAGKIDDRYRFEALVFPEHAESESFELNRSKISKLWIRDTIERKTVFNFDRGMDVAAANEEVAAMVEFLCAGLAEAIHG
jgi:hypothetical protein